MKSLIIILIVVLVGLISCQGVKDIKLTKEKTIQINDLKIEEGTLIFSKYVQDNSEYIYTFDYDNNELLIYSIDNQNLFKKVKLKNMIEGCYIHSMDSIFFTKYEENNIYLMNSKGSIYDTISLNFENDYNLKCVSYSSPVSPLYFVNNSFIFNITFNIPPPSFYNYPTIGLLNQSVNNIVHIGYYPEEMQEGKNWMSFESQYCVDNESNIIVSFPVSHKISVYNSDGVLRNKVSLPSKYFEEPFKALDINNISRKKSLKYEITRQRYNAIKFDPYRNLYYRVFVHDQKFDNEDGTVNEHNSNPWSLQIIDKNFTLIDEILFKPKTYYFRHLLILKDGLLLQKFNSDSENSTSFDLYKIEVI